MTIKQAQNTQRQAVGVAWNDGGFPNLVFTHPDGSHLSQPTVWKALQKILKKAGLERHRFHDLRHTYVVNVFRAGDDVKRSSRMPDTIPHHSRWTVTPM